MAFFFLSKLFFKVLEQRGQLGRRAGQGKQSRARRAQGRARAGQRGKRGRQGQGGQGGQGARGARAFLGGPKAQPHLGFRVFTLLRDQYWSRGEPVPVPGPVVGATASWAAGTCAIAAKNIVVFLVKLCTA